MLHPSTQQLIRKLCELTDAGHIAWTDGERQTSRFESEGYVVEVEAEPPTLRLLRGDGRELERADAADLAATAWPDGQGTYAAHVAEMAAKAHRVARGTEAAIARILSSLSAPPKRGAAPLAQPAPVAPPPAPAPAATSTAPVSPKSAFGAVESFDKAPTPAPAPAKAVPAAPAPPTFLIKGFSARSVQTPDSATIASATAPTPRPPENKREPPPPVSVYKPWN